MKFRVRRWSLVRQRKNDGVGTSGGENKPYGIYAPRHTVSSAATCLCALTATRSRAPLHAALFHQRHGRPRHDWQHAHLLPIERQRLRRWRARALQRAQPSTTTPTACASSISTRDNTTFNSSRATLALPPPRPSSWAGLYWGADRTVGEAEACPQAAPTPRSTIKCASRRHLRLPDPHRLATRSQYHQRQRLSSRLRRRDRARPVGARRQLSRRQRAVRHGRRQQLVGARRRYREPVGHFAHITVFDGFATVTAFFPRSPSTSPASRPRTSGRGHTHGRLGRLRGDRKPHGGTRYNSTTPSSSTRSIRNNNFFNSSITLLGANFTAKIPTTSTNSATTWTT